MGTRKRWLALIMVVGLLLSACAGDDDDAGGQEEDAAPVQGGSFAMSICEPESLSPLFSNETCGSQVLDTLFTGLVQYDAETAEPENVIAESIETEDEQTWTITIEDGWTFHDGEEITAESFVNAWNYGAYGPNAADNNYFFENIEGYADLNPESGRPQTEEMSGLEVVDDLTIEVTLADPFSQFPLTLGYNPFYPLPSAFFDDPEAYNEAPIGNGPYMMDGEWQHNQSIAVTRYEDYPDTPGNADDVEFLIFADLATAYRDLQAGTIDVVDSVPPEQIESAQTEFGDRYLQTPSSSFTYLGFPLYDERFENPDLRRAFSMAIDREAIIEAIFFGTLTPASSVVSPVVQGSREDACEYCTYDPEQAAELLESAGGFDGELKLWFNSDGGHEEWMQAVQNQLRQNLGIENISFESFEFADYLERLDAEDVDGPFRLGWVMDYPSPQNYLQPLHSTTGSSNNTGYSNQEVDDLIAQGNAAPSIEEGITFYHQAEDILLDEMPVIPLWFGLNQNAHSDRIDNVIVDPFSFVRIPEVEVVDQ